MRTLRLLSLLACAIFLTGCPNKPKDQPQTSQPTSQNQLAQLRQRYQRMDRDNRVGVVIAANDANDLVAVGDVNPKDFRVGDHVSFVDSHENPLTGGRVVRIVEGAIHVKYDKPQAGRRTPRPGDVMIRFSQAT